MRVRRRLFLKGLGGAAVAAPFLGSVWERLAKAQGEVSDPPRRLIAMFTHGGCLTNRWFPENSHGALSAADYAGTSLEALAPHAEKLLVVRGIRAMNEWTDDGSLGQGNDPHLQVVGSYFTCAPVTPHAPDPFVFDDATKFDAKPIAPSLDHVCAKQVSPGGTPLFMRVGGGTETPSTAISYSAPEQLYAGVASPQHALTGLTGLFDGDTLSPDDYRTLRGESVLDTVKDDLETLERFDMSGSDRRKLEAWKELLHESVDGMARAQCNAENANLLALTLENLASTNGVTAFQITDSLGDLDIADLYSNAAVLTALCDADRVIFLKYPAWYLFTGLGLSVDADAIAHRTGGGTLTGECLSGVNEMILTIDRYYAAKFAHLVRTLDSFDEGDRTLLDNTATVWFQQYSDGGAMNLNNLPIVQAGGCAGYFKTGYAVNVDGGTSDLQRGNSEATCMEDGSRITDFKAGGTPPEFANAPINKYYCNLMNAIGVKAGEDGFPAEGGTGEVTHYGYYDDTSDFASGGETPPNIKSPGEFSELRANS